MSRHRLIISVAFRKSGKGASGVPWASSGAPSSSPRGCLSRPPFLRLLFSVSSGLGGGDALRPPAQAAAGPWPGSQGSTPTAGARASPRDSDAPPAPR